MLLAIVYLAVVLSYASAISKDYCPSSIPKDKFTKVHGNICYRFELDFELEYENAQSYCRSRGGNLVLIKSSEINDYIKEQLYKFGFGEEAWIGLNDIDVENEFVWVDGTPMGYSNFADEDEGPRSGFWHMFRRHFEDCVAIDLSSEGKWRDYKCDDHLFGIVDEHKNFICEFPIEKPETTPAPSTPPTTTTTTVKMSTTTTPAMRTTGCPEIFCNLDCGMDGFKLDENSCTVCECQGTPSEQSNEPPIPTPVTRKNSSKFTDLLTKPLTTKSPCKALVCDMNCGMMGYKKDDNDCVMCECNV